MTQTLRAEIEGLDTAERLRVIGEIWDSIAEEADARPLTPAQRAELDRRMAAHGSRPEVWKRWEDVKAGLRRKA